MRFLIALLLMGEGLTAGVRVLNLLQTIAIYPWITIVLTVARAVVAVAQFASGGMLMQRQTLGPPLGRLAFMTSAILVVFEVGLALAPSDTFHTYRWPMAAAYCLYAIAAERYLRRIRD